jgi:transcription initiation factor TFIIE subunit alpha
LKSSNEVLIKIVNAFWGKEGEQVVIALENLQEAADDKISLETGIQLNLVRKILYMLNSHSLVSCDRLRDEKTGWYIFQWKLQPDQLEGFIKNQKRKILEKLESRLRYESTHDFYYCNTSGCSRLTFEEAMERVFHCSKCGRTLTHFDNSQIIHSLKNRIERISKEIK